MEKWIVGIEKDQIVECIVTYETEVKTPKFTKHIQPVQWSNVKLQDEVKSILLKIQTSLPNSEGNPRSRSNSSIDCQWMNALKMRRVSSSPSLQHSRPHSPNNLTNFLPYLQNQDTYAAAVRRTQVPVTYQITSLNQSRSSSPTPYLSSLHLSSSKGSSTSSAASDTPSEKDTSKTKSRNNYHSSGSRRVSLSGRHLGRNPASAQATPRNTEKLYRTSHHSTLSPNQHLSRSHDQRRHSHDHRPQQPKSIPGMPLKIEIKLKVEEEEESKVSEGGWTKVDYSKKSHRHHSVGKQSKEKSKGTGKGQKISH